MATDVSQNGSDRRTRPTYPSDISDQQWSQICAILPAEPSIGRNRTTNIRDVVNAINYRWRTGCVWRMLPHDFPPWATVYAYHRQWYCAGVLGELRKILTRAAQPNQAGRLRQFRAA